MDKVDQVVQENSDVWKTKAMFYSFLKGILRKGWSRHPVKLKLLKKHRRQIPNPNPKGKKPTVWGADCTVCGETFIMSQLEVDHRMEETASLTKLSDIQSCVEKLLVVLEEDLRIICKGCHSTHTLSQRQGITFAEAQQEQKVISFKKLNASQQKEKLTQLGISGIMLTTASKRVEAYRQYMKETNNE